MSHPIEEVTLTPNTEVVTSTISYLYHCNICSNERRYTYPIEEVVVCNGDDMGVLVRVGDQFIEINDYNFIINYDPNETYPQDVLDYMILKNYIQIV